MSNDQIDNLLVDFDEKSTDDGSDSDEDESATTPQRPIDGEVSSASFFGDHCADREVQADPYVEYTDEFGRTRSILRSEVPRGTALEQQAPEDECVHSQVYLYDADAMLIAAPT